MPGLIDHVSRFYKNCLCYIAKRYGGIFFSFCNFLQILIATPGRLLDHIENKSGLTSRLMALKLFIVDEADLLLDLGFRRDVEKIIDSLPRQRQSLLFSATIPKEVKLLNFLTVITESNVKKHTV